MISYSYKQRTSWAALYYQTAAGCTEKVNPYQYWYAYSSKQVTYVQICTNHSKTSKVDGQTPALVAPMSDVRTFIFYMHLTVSNWSVIYIGTRIINQRHPLSRGIQRTGHLPTVQRDRLPKTLDQGMQGKAIPRDTLRLNNTGGRRHKEIIGRQTTQGSNLNGNSTWQGHHAFIRGWRISGGMAITNRTHNTSRKDPSILEKITQRTRLWERQYMHFWKGEKNRLNNRYHHKNEVTRKEKDQTTMKSYSHNTDYNIINGYQYKTTS